jgi:3-deoxy-7-phosphoheptulonate synthase
MDGDGISHSNYGMDNVLKLADLYNASSLTNPACIIDTNHDNSAKRHLEQPRIAKEVIKARQQNETVRKLVKGLMTESYLEDGKQDIGGSEIYGKSITDPCLGWQKTEKMIYEIAEML